jgi:aspartate-semialdehyde dehydrogenase
MAGKIVRAAVVGASTLLGKELADELNQAKTVTWDLTLLDTPEAGGQITAAGDEALVIQPVSAEAFAHIDVAFFAGEQATVLEFWKIAHAAGASIVDLTGALEGKPNVIVRTPFVEDGTELDLTTVAVVSAHAAAIILASANVELLPLGLRRMAATVLQPASELGSAGVEEMHQQTVGLLSFKPLKKDVYDAQVAFNVVASIGDSAKVDLERVRQKIGRQIEVIAGAGTIGPIALQLIQVPVFHGYTASVFVEFGSSVTKEAVSAALRGGELRMVEERSPSNETAAGRGEVFFRVTATDSNEGSAFWLWIAADNLRLAARNAVACAMELVELRPTKNVN